MIVMDDLFMKTHWNQQFFTMDVMLCPPFNIHQVCLKPLPQDLTSPECWSRRHGARDRRLRCFAGSLWRDSFGTANHPDLFLDFTTRKWRHNPQTWGCYHQRCGIGRNGETNWNLHARELNIEVTIHSNFQQKTCANKHLRITFYYCSDVKS